MLSQNFITILNLVTITFFAKPQANITVRSLISVYRLNIRNYIGILVISAH